ncbi:histidinol-phosphate transaminase [Shewanella sp. VB17]|uniref:histidinol-phosphate transaminase n=1 Tax=Shewanella sp. VB17 TaxID=2739432 RepID=UPI001566F7D2|nr:histidinol-phosphate transaminase [Shewanella sp. VB17]NRD74231.1 histidinol-phosphate transaminase [Shewanella sp. VB17]
MNKPPLNLAQRLARTELLDLEVYQSARRIGGQGDVWINANESPFNNTNIANINRYPQCQPPELISAYATYSGVSEDSIITSRGADEAIELLIRTFCHPGVDSIACFGPTYGMYAISANTFNVKVKALGLTPEYQLPDDIMTQTQGAKLVFICNPNNPTGTVIETADIEQIIKNMPESIIVVDEAYIEFCPDYSVAKLINKYDNLVVLRTLSKAFALAGLRCGFLLANPQICDLVMRVIAPYPVPVPVSQIATAALSHEGIALIREQVGHLKVCGAQLTHALHSIGAEVLPANGNFVLAKFNTQVSSERLQEAGIVTRAYQDPRLANCIRFSFSDKADTETIINILTQ